MTSIAPNKLNDDAIPTLAKTSIDTFFSDIVVLMTFYVINICKYWPFNTKNGLTCSTKDLLLGLGRSYFRFLFPHI